MLTNFIHSKRFNETIFIGVLSVFCFCMSLFRFEFTQTKMFLFLNWNLFLAFIPWAMTSMAVVQPKFQNSKLFVFALMGAWLLFFPNAPYILTDLFHLKADLNMPIWFDLLLVLSFAWTGLLYGFMSLWDIESILSKYFSKKYITLSSITLLLIGSFGIYVGRFLRWNSWDIIREPHGIMYDIGDRVVNPMNHPRAWGMTLFMWLFLTMLYLSFKFIMKRSRETTT